MARSTERQSHGRNPNDPTPDWFWSPDWQAGEREVDADRAAGRIESFSSDEEFIGTLRGRAKNRARRTSA